MSPFFNFADVPDLQPAGPKTPAPAFPRLDKSLQELEANIPAELRARRQWFIWKAEHKEGQVKATKVPYRVDRPGVKASTTNEKSWGTFEQAVKVHAKTPDSTGIGYVFTEQDQYIGIDLDHCIDSNGEIAPWAQEKLEQFQGAYQELSVSRTGIHIIAQGNPLQHARKVGDHPVPGCGVEVYDRTRYFTVSGEALKRVESIADCSSAVARLLAELPRKGTPAKPATPSASLALDDNELLHKAMNAKNGPALRQLWEGDSTGYPSHSEADQALCNLLAFWTGPDPERIDRLFRQSGLMREKWEREDYRRDTIANALAGRTEFYGQRPHPNNVIPIRPRFQQAEIQATAEPTATPEEPHLTDLGNAKRLVDQHGEDMRYCEALGGWLVWDNTRWTPDLTGETCRRAKQTVLALYVEASHENLDARDRKMLVDHARRSESASRIRAMLELAQSEPGIPVLIESLDTDPWLLNVENGTLDLRAGTLRPHRREDLITKKAPVRYDPAATCPMWRLYLDCVMAESEELVGYLQRVCGYMTTASTREEICLILHGKGRNGKGVFTETVASLLGEDYSRKVPSELLLESRLNGMGATPELARLRGVRFAHASEAEEGRRLKEALLKESTGGDTITARFLHQNPFDFRPTHKLVYATNHKPLIRGTDEGIWSRIHLVPFTVYIPPEKRDKDLKEKLRAELPGILNWVLAGCLEWQRAGLNPPQEVVNAIQEYRSESDVVAGFIDECCEVSRNAQVTVKALYAAYVRWCDANGETAKPQRSFSTTLTERGFGRNRGTGSVHTRTGITLRATREMDEERVT